MESRQGNSKLMSQLQARNIYSRSKLNVLGNGKFQNYFSEVSYYVDIWLAPKFIFLLIIFN